MEGYGSEPHVEFDRQLVEFSAILPFADDSEAEVVISNPLPYPIEMYSLDFDKQYLEEEEVYSVNLTTSSTLISCPRHPMALR